MSYVMNRSADVLSIAIGVILGGSVLALAGRGAAVIPSVDGWLFPIVRFDDVTDIYREAHSVAYTTGRACFTLHLTKLRGAAPEPYRFAVQADFGEPQGVSAYLAEPDNARSDDQGYGQPHPVGASWPRRYCFEFPGTIADAAPVTVSGKAIHRRVPFWLTETAMPSFTIGPARRM